MSLKPLQDRVAVEVLESEQKTPGGVIIPDTAKEKPIQGVVVAVGEGIKSDSGNRVAVDVKVGDKVLFGKWSGTEVEVNNKKLLIMKESDIMGVIETV
ncbi:MAG: co-chaperone GroES [Alphaproteobacteria bacterium]|nr:co-chaperone GroES [Alphaproteobacteria bacterium]